MVLSEAVKICAVKHPLSEAKNMSSIFIILKLKYKIIH
jgi:hypothetical protein